MDNRIADAACFKAELLKQGITDTRIQSLGNAVYDLHKALCELDYNNLDKLNAIGGLRGMLSIYAKVEEQRDISID